MSHDDERPDWLREQLDRELEPVVSRPGALGDVLRRARQQRPWWRRSVGRVGVPAWFVAAAAVVVVALAVPFLSGSVLGRDTPADRLASSPVSSVPVSSATPTATPAPTVAVTPPPATTSSPTGHATASRTSVPPPVLKTSPAGSCSPGSAAAGSTGAGVGVDLDGDGRADVVTYDSTAGALVVRLASGGQVSTPFATAGPYAAVLPVESDGTAGSELLVLTRGAVGNDGSVGQSAVLYDLAGCSFGTVRNALGTPYTFQVGSSEGDSRRAGVACDGTTLLGVTSVRDVKGDWDVTRTPVSSATGRALNGTPAVSVVDAGSPATQGLQEAHCGPATAQSLD